MIFCLIISALVILFDRISKQLIVQNIALGENVKCIDGLFHFTYIRNRGAAFGMLADNRWVFMVVSVVAIGAIIVYIAKAKPKNIFLKLALGMILGGGIGNMIDRTVFGYVVDFIEVEFVDFAIFNVADSFVCIACGILIIYILVTAKNEKKEKQISEAVVAEKESENND